jgi:hypothetical protein
MAATAASSRRSRRRSRARRSATRPASRSSPTTRSANTTPTSCASSRVALPRGARGRHALRGRPRRARGGCA